MNGAHKLEAGKKLSQVLQWSSSAALSNHGSRLQEKKRLGKERIDDFPQKGRLWRIKSMDFVAKWMDDNK